MSLRSLLSVRPSQILICPIGVDLHDSRGGDGGIADGDDGDVDPKMAMMGDPIVGMERVTYDDTTGSGALSAQPLTAPKSMTALQRAVHDLTHLPY